MSKSCNTTALNFLLNPLKQVPDAFSLMVLLNLHLIVELSEKTQVVAVEAFLWVFIVITITFPPA